MRHFISLHKRHGDDIININVDRIDSYRELEEMNFTVVVVNGRNEEVKETAYEITKLIYQDIDIATFLGGLKPEERNL